MRSSGGAFPAMARKLRTGMHGLVRVIYLIHHCSNSAAQVPPSSPAQAESDSAAWVPVQASTVLRLDSTMGIDATSARAFLVAVIDWGTRRTGVANQQPSIRWDNRSAGVGVTVTDETIVDIQATSTTSELLSVDLRTLNDAALCPQTLQCSSTVDLLQQPVRQLSPRVPQQPLDSPPRMTLLLSPEPPPQPLAQLSPLPATRPDHPQTARPRLLLDGYHGAPEPRAIEEALPRRLFHANLGGPIRPPLPPAPPGFPLPPRLPSSPCPPPPPPALPSLQERTQRFRISTLRVREVS